MRGGIDSGYEKTERGKLLNSRVELNLMGVGLL